MLMVGYLYFVCLWYFVLRHESDGTTHLEGNTQTKLTDIHTIHQSPIFKFIVSSFVYIAKYSKMVEDMINGVFWLLLYLR